MASITLNIDANVLKRANDLAVARKMTLEQMLDQWLQALAQPPVRVEDLAPITRRLYGIMPAMSDDGVQRLLDQERDQSFGGK